MWTLPRVQTLVMVTNVGFVVRKKEADLMGCYRPSQRFGSEEQVTLLLVLSVGVE